MEQRYTAFISYRHASPDQAVAKRLHTAIETYHIPGAIQKLTGRKQMGKCFRDQEELPLSPDLGDDIERALDNSDWLIAVCTPRYLQSRWCLREMEYFIEHKGRERVLVVLADGEPAESFPEMLLWRIDETGRRVAYEPLAADVRGATDAERAKKLKTEKLRMLAPILGVGFDDLRRRARQRRIRTIAGVCAAVIVAGAGLGAYVAVNRAKQERLRLEAEEQQRLAAEQARIAEEERLRAVENSIGEQLERAAAQLTEGERLAAVGTLLDAVGLSEENDGLRRGEIITALQKAACVMPFEPVAEFSNQNVRLLDIDPAPDGRLAVGVENGDAVAVIDLVDNELRYKVSAEGYQIAEPKFSPDGKRFLAMCDNWRYVTVWNVDDGSVAFTYESKANIRDRLASVCFWGDGDTILVQDMDSFYLVRSDGTEKLFYRLGDRQQADWYDYDFNLLTIIYGKPIDQLITLMNDDYAGTPLTYTPDRSRVVVGNRAGETGALVLDGDGEVVTPLYGMPGTKAEQYAISDDGKRLVCLSRFGFRTAWDAENGDLLWIDELGGDTSSMSAPVISPDGSRAIYVLDDVFYMLDMETGDVLLNGSMDSNGIVPKVCYSADGEYIFILNQSLYITDKNGTIFNFMAGDSSAPFNNTVQLGDKVLLTKNDGTAWICCTPAGSSIHNEGPADVPALCPAYDPTVPPADNPFVSLIGAHDLTEAFKANSVLADQPPGMWFSMDGKRAALSYPDGFIEVFEDPASGAVSLSLGQLTQQITALAITSDRLIACDGGGRLLFYDLSKREVIQILNTELPSAGFALDAKREKLMSARYLSDGIGSITVYDVYDIETASLLFTMRATEPVSEFGFAADGSCALCVTDSGALRAELWTDEAALLAYARTLSAR